MTSAVCAVDECGRKHLALGFCRRHYGEFQSHGKIRTVEEKMGACEVYLREHIGYAEDECLIWPFTRDKNGYGRLKVRQKTLLASRLMCELAHGPPPTPKHQAAHSCGKGGLGCFHPGHLRWATKTENENDKAAHGTLPYGDRHASSKLTEAQARQILSDRRPQAVLAEELGVCQQTVSLIRRGKLWKHLEREIA